MGPAQPRFPCRMRQGLNLFVLTSLLLIPIHAQEAPGPRADPIALTAPVTDVLVYSQGARVLRRGSTALPAGSCTLYLGQLPAGILPGTASARLVDAAGVRLAALRETVRPGTIVAGSDYANALAQRDQIDLESQTLKDRQAMLTERITILRSLASTAPELPAELATGTWRGLLDFVDTRSARALDDLRLVNSQLTTLTQQRTEVQQSIALIETDRLPAELGLELHLEAAAAVPAAVVEITYQVGQAAWYPAYGFQVDPADGATEMVRSAWIAQGSGEDWTDAAVTVASGMPVRVAALPALSSWRIGGATTSLEPERAGTRPPSAATIVRPEAIAAAQAAFLDHPFARRSRSLGAGFDHEPGGSLQALEGTFLAIGAGGGASGAFGARTGGGRKRAIGRFGGSAASENTIDGGFGWFARMQEPDGSWSSARHGGHGGRDVGDTALALLSYLGAGFDHISPSRHRDTVSHGMDWLLAQQASDGRIGRDLLEQALATTVLAEALSMTNAISLRDPAHLAVQALCRRLLAAPYPLQPDLARGTWPADPSNLAFVVLALKAAKAAGLETDELAWLQVFAFLGEMDRLPRTALTAAAGVACRIYTGHDRDDEAIRRDTDVLLATLPLAWEQSRFDLRTWYHGTLGTFQVGGDRWKRWNEHYRDLLVHAQVRAGDDAGSWDPIGADGALGGGGGSRVWSTALAALSLQVYYRYLPIAGGGSSSDTRADTEQESFTSPYLSAGGRDLRWSAVQRETVLGNGRWKPVTLERRSLHLRLEHVAVPIAYGGAYLRGLGSNDNSLPLLAGEARIQARAESLGSVLLDTIAPGEPIAVPLGIDGAVRVKRSSAVTEKAAGFKDRLRRADYTVTIEVANQRATAIDLVVRDRVPRPADARIQVLDLACQPEPEHYDPGSDSGELRFRVAVAAGGTATVRIAYAVETPSDLAITGMEESHD